MVTSFISFGRDNRLNQLEKATLIFPLKSLLVVILIAAVFSSLTLWLIDSWVKYPFFVLEISTIIVVYLIVSGYDFRLSTTRVKIESLRVDMAIDAFLVVSATSLLLLNMLGVQGGLIQLILALFVTSILPGYALLNIFGLNGRFSNLEILVLSYVLSFVFTGLITLSLLFVSESMRLYFALSTFILIGSVSLLKRNRHVSFQTQRSFARNVDSLGITVAIASLALSFYFMYPGFALLPEMDISRHYASSVLLWRTPALYNIFNYFLAHLHESVFIAASSASMASIQTALVTLNLFLPLAFYVMAKSYSESIDSRLPALSTVFFSIFSGFAWIYLAKLKLTGSAQSELSLLSLVNDGAYNGAMYLAQPSLWYVPLSMSFTILTVQLMLIRKLNFSKRSFVALFSLLTVAGYMTHVTEAVILSLFLGFYAFFSRNKSVRLNDALLGSVTGFAFLDAFYIILQYCLGKTLGFSLAIPLIATLVLAAVYAHRTLKVQDKLIAVLPKLSGELLAKLLAYATTFTYLLGLAAWLVGIPSFRTSMVVEVGAIPWFVYPIFLGIGGVLMLVSLYYLLEDHETMRLLMPFLALLIFSLLFGRALTFINVNLFSIGYWEKRFTAYFFLASAVIAPIAIIKVVDGVRRNQARVKRTLLPAAIVSVVIVCGLQSFFVVTEYWAITSAPPYQISEGEFQAINYLSSVLQQDKYAYTITLTSGSYNSLTFAAPPYQLSGMQVFSTAENPEMPFVCLKARNYPHAYLYMDNRDYAQLNKNVQSWLATHLLPTLPIIYRNPEATIYNVSSVSFPQTNSTTALVVPFDESVSPTKSWLYAYDSLSLGKYGYTVVYDLDPNIFSYDSLVLSIDPPSKNPVEKSFEDNFSAENGWQPISGTWQYVEGGLEAGKLGEYQDAIFLSPVSARNFTANINFKPLDGDIKVANYVSIIYDWKNQANYKYAGLTFDTDGDLHAYLASYANGQVTNYPAWPGLKIDLERQFGDSFNLTVSVQGTDAVLYINGSQYLSMKTRITGGLLGIRSTRFYQVLFTGFEAVSSNAVQLRNVDDYLSYVENGGRLIVLNTDGYGYFADQMLTRSNLTITANMINGSEVIKLPASLTVPELSPKSDNIVGVAYYLSPENSSIYAAEEKLGAGEIIYVNIYPIINAVDQSDDKASFYDKMDCLLKPADIPLEPFMYSSEIISTFRQVTMSGNVNVSSSSLLSPIAVDFGKVYVTFADGSISPLVNVTRVSMPDHTNIDINASNLTLGNGNGFYASLKFGDDATITPENNSTCVTVSTADGDTTQFANIKTITINDNDVMTLCVRQPTISVRGLIAFKELYSTGGLYQKTQTQGQDLNVIGDVKLTVYLSDTYTWVSALDVSGSLERIPPLLAYDELSSLSQAAFWGLFPALIFIITLSMLKKRESKMTPSAIDRY
jgi:hypothetical protein